MLSKFPTTSRWFTKRRLATTRPTKILQGLLKKTEKPDNNYSQADRNNRAIFIERLGMVYRDQENYPALPWKLSAR